MERSILNTIEKYHCENRDRYIISFGMWLMVLVVVNWLEMGGVVFGLTIACDSFIEEA